VNSSPAIAYGTLSDPNHPLRSNPVQPGARLTRLRKDQELVVDLLQQRTDMANWPTVRDFWAAYFKRTGANLKSYSVLRDLPDLHAETGVR